MKDKGNGVFDNPVELCLRKSVFLIRFYHTHDFAIPTLCMPENKTNQLCGVSSYLRFPSPSLNNSYTHFVSYFIFLLFACII